jgi:LPXTG-site transpeptidase (sortase) family protein
MTTQAIGTREREVSRVVRMLSVAVLLTMLTTTFVGSKPAVAKAPSKYFVAATGHVIAEPFLSGWISRDGLTTLGLPVSEPGDTNDRISQYFEYGYLMSRSASTAAKDLRLQRTSRDLLATQHQPDRAVAGRRVGSARTTSAFVVSDNGAAPKLSGRTKSFYERHGGEDRFGEPISTEYVAFGMRTQWFEFGRLQWSVEDKKVAAAPIGKELATARGVDLTPVDRNGLPSFNPKRFRKFTGDGFIPNATKAFSPVKIEIPKIAVNAGIERVGIDQGVMGTPVDAWKVGWYDDLASPGDWTNVVMAGHRDWWNIGPVVFWNLDKLAAGDKIYLVGSDGKGSTYVVTEAWSVGADINANTIISDAGTEMLTLITCDGSFNGAEYESRRIVRAERI